MRSVLMARVGLTGVVLSVWLRAWHRITGFHREETLSIIGGRAICPFSKTAFAGSVEDNARINQESEERKAVES